MILGKTMSSPTYVAYENGTPEIVPGIVLTEANMDKILKTFVKTFGEQPLRDHPDLKPHHFYCDSIPYLMHWEMTTALQIAVDTTAACADENEEVMSLKQLFRDLIGPCKNETLVRIQHRAFVIERPPAPF
jgi:hypothetical protein